MLTKKQRQWILSERNNFIDPETSQKRQRDQRIRDKAKKMLYDLTFLAENLDPDQHKQVFTAKFLEPFAKALHHYSTIEKKRTKTKKDEIVVNRELFDAGICMSKWFLSLSRNLVSERYYNLIWGTDQSVLTSKKDIEGLTTIYFATRNRDF